MIDINKQYRTRDGREVRIYAVDCGGDFPVHGAFYNPLTKKWEARIWPDTGYCYSIKDPSLSDLIEVKPRIQQELWLNVYRAKENRRRWAAFESREEADLFHPERIACVRVLIDCEEGEGL